MSQFSNGCYDLFFLGTFGMYEQNSSWKLVQIVEFFMVVPLNCTDLETVLSVMHSAPDFCFKITSKSSKIQFQLFLFFSARRGAFEFAFEFCRNWCRMSGGSSGQRRPPGQHTRCPARTQVFGIELKSGGRQLL
jgi:hypothetical protein